MRIAAVSDLHGNLPDIPPCDLLIVAGDICPDFARSDRALDVFGVHQRNWLDRDFRPWLHDAPAEHIVGIAGNHDFVFEHHDLYGPLNLPWTYLEDAVTLVEGLSIYGTPWVPKLPLWAFYASDEQLEERVDAIPANIDVLVSHGPPYGHLDRAPGYGHVGDWPLEMSLKRGTLLPQLLICGHVHDGFGKEEHPNLETTIYNVSLVDEEYEPVNGVTEIEL